MRISKVFILAVAAQLASGMAFAQSDKSKAESGHHYQGQPKTDVPHHMKDMKANTTGSSSKKSTKGSHGYQGGPKTEVPHKMNR